MRTRFTRICDGFFFLGIACVIVGGLVVVIDKMRDKPAMVVQVHTPNFKVGDCFVRNGIRETWDREADGKVIFRGISRYVLMDAAEAEHRSASNKYGFEQNIETFDETHRQVLCPLSWTPKRIEKPK